jgi:hypothetical protein
VSYGVEKTVTDMPELCTGVLALDEWADARRPMVGLSHSWLMPSLAMANRVRYHQ